MSENSSYPGIGSSSGGIGNEVADISVAYAGVTREGGCEPWVLAWPGVRLRHGRDLRAALFAAGPCKGAEAHVLGVDANAPIVLVVRRHLKDEPRHSIDRKIAQLHGRQLSNHVLQRRGVAESAHEGREPEQHEPR